MRLLILIPLLAVSACTSYQYYTLNSSLSENNQGAFVFENDTLLLEYTFSGYGGPVQIEISNKLDVPLIIDWKKSSIILDGYSRPHWRDEATFNANDYAFNISGVITRPTEDSFVPPHSSLEVKWDQVITKPMDFGANTTSERVNCQGIEAKRYTFSTEDTPLVFRSYLSFRLNESSVFFHYDHYFWVAEAHQSISDPNSLMCLGQSFYTSEPTGAGAVLGVLALGGIIWMAVEMDEAEQ